jgi:type IX secretion system PorP/SprF family membrane protein
MKTLMNIKSKLLVLSLIITSGLAAQDLHFSQFMNSPLSTNPANTGFIPEADFRIGGTYRRQYAAIIDQPYKTSSLFFDAQLMRDKFENGWLGVGSLLLTDVAGPGSLRSTKAYGSIAYHQTLGYGSLLSVGFNGGFVQKRIDPTKFTWDDQWNGKFFDAAQPTGEVLATNNINYFDLQAGLNYAYFPTTSTYVNAGFSIHHINRPAESFFATTAGKSFVTRLAPRYIAFANGIFKVSDRVIAQPSAYFTKQATASELVVGSNFRYNLAQEYDATEKEFIVGLYYRYKDAIVPTIGFRLKNLQITFSYDATASGLTPFNRARGAEELNIIHNGFYKYTDIEDRKLNCPTPRF